MDVPRLREALDALPRHEAMLRASFHLEAGRAVCRYAKRSVSRSARSTRRTTLRPAPRSCVPSGSIPPRSSARRSGRTRTARAGSFFDLHHIIGDGLSVPRLLHKKLDALYGGRTPQASGIAFRDYAVYAAARGADEAALSYLKETLTPMPEPLLIPPDNPRPKAFDFRGGQYALSWTARRPTRARRSRRVSA